MRTVTSKWTTNFTQDISASGLLVATLKALLADSTVDRTWTFDNATAGNVVEATVISTCDLSGATLPLESAILKVQNKTNDADASAAVNYDFTDTHKAELARPCVLNLSLGLTYDDATTEVLTITGQQLKTAEVSDDDAHVTFETESFTAHLDTSIFYGGRYDPAGIPAATLFAEVLADALFPVDGDWQYTLGDANCKTSTTRPLWARDDAFVYYHIDSALTQLVYLPIPPVSHREALAMLAAYSGALLKYRDDGSLDVIKVA
jgi:hypothetical protein